jgi:ABC-2 type transport system ATP-binding protein
MMNEILKIDHLCKSYGKRPVLKDISLRAYSGEVLGFLGPNGAGKTTLIKTVMGFLFADSGSIYIDGIDIKKDYEKAMALVGGIVENPEMYKDLTGRKNLEMYSRVHGNIDRARIDEVVSLVGMQNRVDEKIGNYSLGMKQRLGLAQALVHKPKLLILDEPTNGLDPIGIRDLRDILKKYARESGAAVVVSSHQLFEMEMMCDRVCIISNGVILGESTIDEINSLNQSGATFRYAVKDKELSASLADERQISYKLLDGDFIEFYLNEDDVPDLTRLLAENGAGVYGIEKQKKSLEQAFIDITKGGNEIV